MPDINKKAIEKIETEMNQNKNNSYIQVVGGFLLQHLAQHPDSAEKILQGEKTIAKSLDEMRKEAEKKKVGNCAVLTDQEGFAVVLKYYGIETDKLKPAELKEIDIQAPKIQENKSKTDIEFDVNLEDLLK